ncbi:MAG: DUF2064 domain-containing protein [Desulfobacteraceae bacterium]|nr:DUF2064 domain-containing protein [Desulfobacteraceae bacterium]
MAETDHRIIVFGRYPVSGATKTRLIPALGPLRAAQLQRCLTEQVLESLSKTRFGPITFCFQGGSVKKIRRWLGKQLDLQPQVKADLGRRMYSAMDHVFEQGARKVVLVGTDIAGMQPWHVEKAFEALNTHDVVLGPAADGGYWLVGSNRPVDIFRNINWGTDQVLAQTLESARRLGLKVARTAVLNDIDTPEDLTLRLPAHQWSNPYLSVVIPALNESEHISSTINRVLDNGVEVIVVDGGSSDDTVAKAHRTGARVFETAPGRAVQQNFGAAQAKGAAILFLHADTRLPENYGRQVFDLLLDPKTVMGAFRFKTDYNNRFMRFIELAVDIRSRVFKLPYGDQAFFMRKSTFDRAGGFPDAPIAEDLFFVRRLARMGKVVICPDYIVTSGRRWRSVGIFRVTLINYFIAAGCLLGVNPERLAYLYKTGFRKNRRQF